MIRSSTESKVGLFMPVRSYQIYGKYGEANKCDVFIWAYILDGYQSNNTLQRGAIFIWRLMAVITYIPYDIVGGCDLSYLGLFCFSSLVLLVGMVSYLEGKTSVVIYSIRSDSPSLLLIPLSITCVSM